MRNTVVSHKTVIAILLLALGVAYTTWLVKQASTPTLNKPRSSQHSDAFMYNFTLVETDKDGKLHSNLSGTTLTHYRFRNTILVQDPYFILYSSDAAPWHITAKQGYSIRGQERIDLKQDVVIKQLSLDQQPHTMLKTSAITIYPQQHYADTTQYVEFTEPSVSLKGIGMQAYLQEKRFRLLKNVRGTHEFN